MDDRAQDYKNTIIELKDKLEAQNQEVSELLKHFELAIVDTKDDMRIMNSFGAIDEIFGDAEKQFERGNSLIKAIYKVTKNSKPRPEETDDEQQHTQEQLDLEELVTKFVTGTREEREFQIIGETDKGDIFLLVWRIKRNDRNFRSYFKVIPTNSIIRSLQEKHEAEIEQIKQDMRLTFENVQDGITMLSLKNQVLFMNESAKSLYFNNKNHVTKNANFEGRLFQEIFVNEDAEIVKDIVDFNRRVVITREPYSYSKKIGEQDVSFHLKPILNERKFIIGILIISRISSNDVNIDTGKLFNALKNLSIDNKKLYSKVKDLEINLSKTNERAGEFQNALKLFYSFLEKMPCPMSIIRLPNMQYEFVNTRFEQKVNHKREHIRGKKDTDLFNETEVATLSEFVNISLRRKDIVYIDENGLKLKQSVLFNNENEPTHIIRVFDDN
jgi:PAS domain-containing protein